MIDGQIVFLRQGLAEAQLIVQSRFNEWTDQLIHSHKDLFSGIHHLTNNIKAAVVDILRNVLVMLGKTANLLPESIRSMIKKFVLSLPDRWVIYFLK